MRTSVWPILSALSAIFLVVEASFVFPSVNDVPTKYTKRGSYKKATKAIHDAAASVLVLAKEELEPNWVISPLSLSSVLGQLMLGANGDLHQVLGDILSPGDSPGLEVHRELGNLMKYLQDSNFMDYVLSVNNGLFLDSQIRLRPEYKHALYDIYNVHVYPAKFGDDPIGSLNYINDWVRRETRDRIKKVLHQPAPANTASIYVNAVYFKGDWVFPFDPLLTKPGLFSTGKNSQTTVDYMVSDVETLFTRDEDCKCIMVGVPYKGSEVKLYVFMPDEKNFDFNMVDFASYLTLERMDKIMKQGEYENMTISFPKFKITTTLSLEKPIMRALREKETTGRLFSQNYVRKEIGSIKKNRVAPNTRRENSAEKIMLNLNMSTASSDSRFHISEIFHQVDLEMTESGTEAAAVTAALVNYHMSSQFIRINRPFVFLIKHEKTGANLFWGGISNPQNRS